MPVHKRHGRKRHVHHGAHRRGRRPHARGRRHAVGRSKAHKSRRGSKLTKRQLMQRKYAGKLRSLRAKLAKKGRGVARILKGASAQKLRRKYGLHNPYAKR